MANPTACKTKQLHGDRKVAAACPAVVGAGRLLEPVGNGGPREMVAAP